MATRMLAGVQATADRFVSGMKNPRRNPKQAALAANGKWKDKTQKAIQQDRFARGVHRRPGALAGRVD